MSYETFLQGPLAGKYAQGMQQFDNPFDFAKAGLNRLMQGQHHGDAENLFGILGGGGIHAADPTGSISIGPGGSFNVMPTNQIWNLQGGIGGSSTPIGGFYEGDVTGMTPQGTWGKPGFNTNQLIDPIERTPADVAVDQGLINAGHLVPADDLSAGRRLANQFLNR